MEKVGRCFVERLRPGVAPSNRWRIVCFDIAIEGARCRRSPATTTELQAFGLIVTAARREQDALERAKSEEGRRHQAELEAQSAEEAKKPLTPKRRRNA